MTRVRVPVVGNFLTRNSTYLVDNTDKDQHFINCYPESVYNPETQQKRLYVKNRPGTKFYATSTGISPPQNTSGGLTYWEATNKLYAASGYTLYAQSGSVLNGINTDSSSSNTRSGFAAYKEGTVDKLFFCNGTNAYIINTSNTVVDVTDADFPSPHIPTPVVMDGYVFIATSKHIYNSKLEDASSWDPTNFITPEQYTDSIVTIARQLNQIVAFGTKSIEFFYNAGNATGSPLKRTDQAVLQVGAYDWQSIASAENLIMFVARNNSGNLTIGALENMRLTTVSTEPIERRLNEYMIRQSDLNANHTINMYGNFIHADGHMFYVLYIKQDRAGGSPKTYTDTFVYDVTEKLWSEWELDPIRTCEKNGVTYLQKSDYVTIYQMNSMYMKDDITPVPGAGDPTSTPITMTVQTALMDLGSSVRKFLSKLYIVGDWSKNESNTTTPLEVSWSDDDYTTWSTSRTIQLGIRSYLTQLGAFRRRAFKLVSTLVAPVRIEFLELEVDEGEN